MLTIRFNRTGKRNKASFRVVVQEHTVAPGGRHVEVLGAYDPHSKKAVLDAERAKYWISRGAQLSDTVHNLFVRQGIVTGPKRAVKIPKPKTEEVQTEAAPKAAAETPAEKADASTAAAKTAA